GPVPRVSRPAGGAGKGARRYARVVLKRSRAARGVAERGSRSVLRWSGPRARRASVVGGQAARLVASAIAATCVLVVNVVADALEWLWPRVGGAGRSARRSARSVLDRVASRAA